MPLLIFPVLSVLGKDIGIKQLKIVLKSYISFSLCLAIYIILFVFIKKGISEVFTSSVVYHIIKGDFLIFDIHPIYTSVFFLFSIILLLYDLLNNFEFKKIFINLPIILVFLLAIAILASKIILILLFLSLIFLVFFSKKISLMVKSILFLLIGIGTFLLISQIKVINARFYNLFFTFINEDIKFLAGNSTFKRLQIYSCSLDIVKDNFLFGVGVGDVQNYLNECYKVKEFDIENTKSAHNFYFRTLLNTGVLGLILFLHSLFINIKLSFADKTRIYLFLSLSFISLMFVEDYLIRAYGVTLYALINHIFYLYNKKPLSK
ncbi:O-antigen ligase [Aquimarina sp. AD1]|uniref:O-antigen ligase family protein n=1 Tax=Aquimarina sp. (strain AD1) TaxID=1714848 RepID=UPI001F08357C|nr:O-antigen ligase family protein [Aquimarina sp. AD1]